MKILLVSVVDPAHAGGGGSALRGLLSLLSGIGAEVRCVSEEAPLLSGLHRVSSLARSMVSPLPSKALFQAGLRRRVRRAVEEGDGAWDLVVLFGADLLDLLDVVPASVPRVLIALNLEHELFEHQIGELRGAPEVFRKLLRRDQAKLRRFEEEGFARVRNVVFLSARDRRSAEASVGDLHSLTLPPLFEYEVDVAAVRPPIGEPVRAGFMANFTWWPNQAALRWLRDEVLPRSRGDLEIHLFGKGSERLSEGHPRIRSHGFVADRERIWGACDLMLCPVVTGSGVPVKLAEVIYNGMPVLATPHAARGLPIESGEGIVVLAGADEWAAFLDSPDAMKLAGERPPEEVRERFSQRRYRDSMRDFLRRAAASL